MIAKAIALEILGFADRIAEAYKLCRPSNGEPSANFLLDCEPDDPEHREHELREKALFLRLMELTDSEVLDLLAIMYLGRECRKFTPPDNLPEGYTVEDYLGETGIKIRTGNYYFELERGHLSSLNNTKDLNANQMCEKIQLSDYLRKGIAIVSEQSVVG